MSAQLYTLLEPLVVALIVLVSAIAVLRKHAPKLWSRLTGRSAGVAACHDSSSGCASCGSCDSPAAEQPIHMHRVER
ncbi:MAG: hypothetical protein JWL63_474 [Rhodocyclales bacterium]|nr:hypothetical protein [Rhodocyclales bacterium]